MNKVESLRLKKLLPWINTFVKNIFSVFKFGAFVKYKPCEFFITFASFMNNICVLVLDYE